MKSTFTNTDGDSNSVARQISTENIGVVYDRSLFLPSYGASCVGSALNSGIIDSTTDNVCVEKCADTYQRMQKSLEKHAAIHRGVRFRTYNTPLERIDPSGLNEEHKFGYGYVDLCGNCNARIASWLLKTADRWMRPGTRLAFKFCNVGRFGVAPKWLRGSYEELVAKNPCPMRDADMSCKETNGWERPWPTRDASKYMPTHQCVYAQFAILWSCLPYRFDVSHSMVYQDKATPMVFFHGHLTDEPVPIRYRRTMQALTGKWFGHYKEPSIKPLGMAKGKWSWDDRNLSGRRPNYSNIAYDDVKKLTLV